MTRRRFIQHGSAATVAAVSGITGAETKPWRLRLSTSTIHFKSLPVEEACRRIAAGGFAAVDIWSRHAGCPHLDDVLDRVGAAKLMSLLGELQLKLCAFSVYRGGYRKYARLLADCGGGVAVRGSTRAAPKGELLPRMRAFLDSLKPDLELCEQYDSHLGIENHANALLHTLDSFKAFVDLNTHPRLGIALAPFHLQGIGVSVPDAIRVCGSQLKFFYAWQRGKELDQLPGHGPADFTPWLAALAEVGYAGYVNPFTHHHVPPDAMSAALTKSRDYLRRCAGALNAD